MERIRAVNQPIVLFRGLGTGGLVLGLQYDRRGRQARLHHYSDPSRPTINLTYGFLEVPRVTGVGPSGTVLVARLHRKQLLGTKFLTSRVLRGRPSIAFAARLVCKVRRAGAPTYPRIAPMANSSPVYRRTAEASSASMSPARTGAQFNLGMKPLTEAHRQAAPGRQAFNECVLYGF